LQFLSVKHWGAYAMFKEYRSSRLEVKDKIPSKQAQGSAKSSGARESLRRAMRRAPGIKFLHHSLATITYYHE